MRRLQYALAWHMTGCHVTASKLHDDREAALAEARALQFAGAVVRLVNNRGRVLLSGTAARKGR